MTDFESFNLVFDNLVTYWTGSYTILALFLVVIFIMVMLARDVDLRYAFVFVMPLIGLFVAIGWFNSVSNNQWIINLALVLVAFIYGMALLRFST